jgi:hypothetical protein
LYKQRQQLHIGENIACLSSLSPSMITRSNRKKKEKKEKKSRTTKGAASIHTDGGRWTAARGLEACLLTKALAGPQCCRRRPHEGRSCLARVAMGTVARVAAVGDLTWGCCPLIGGHHWPRDAELLPRRGAAPLRCAASPPGHRRERPHRGATAMHALAEGRRSHIAPSREPTSAASAVRAPDGELRGRRALALLRTSPDGTDSRSRSGDAPPWILCASTRVADGVDSPYLTISAIFQESFYLYAIKIIDGDDLCATRKFVRTSMP